MIYIVMLAYNEAAGIEALLKELEQLMRRQGQPYRLVVVNDGSADGTREKVESLAKVLPITLLNHEKNKGVGGAFNTGLRHVAETAADSDTAITMEADRTNDSACIPEMLRAIDRGFDVVCASRYVPGGRYVGFPWSRHLFSLGANWIMRLFFPVPGVKDFTIFYRAYRARVIAAAVRHYGDRFIEQNGFTSNAEILYKIAAVEPIRATEVPVVYRYDLKKGKSKMRVYKNIKEYGHLFKMIRLLPRKRLETVSSVQDE